VTPTDTLELLASFAAVTAPVANAVAPSLVVLDWLSLIRSMEPESARAMAPSTKSLAVIFLVSLAEMSAMGSTSVAAKLASGRAVSCVIRWSAIAYP
jgi:hypothetical protein